MTGDRARSALAGTRFGDVRWVDETGSTNRDLLALAAQGAADGTVLVADHQTSGRGRLDRTWQAPPGASLLVSVLFRLPITPFDSHLLTTAVGVSAVEACHDVAGVDAGLKWPNDLVVVSGQGRTETMRKLGGILAETVVEGGAMVAVVVGLGLNVDWPLPLPDDLADIAIALNQLSPAGEAPDREAVLIALLQRLDHWTDRIVEPDDAGCIALMDRARALSATLGRHVRVDLGREQFDGLVVELPDTGELIVEDEDGRHRVVVVGDVVHIHPTS